MFPPLRTPTVASVSSLMALLGNVPCASEIVLFSLLCLVYRKALRIRDLGEGFEKGNSSSLLVEIHIRAIVIGSSMQVLIKSRTSTQPRIPSSAYTPRG